MLEVVEGDETCISCCNRNRKAKKIKINRNGSSKQGENITTFVLCSECLLQLAQEFGLYI